MTAVEAASEASDTAAQSESEEQAGAHLRDRGTGVVTSVPGAYVREGEVLFYSWVAYSGDSDIQYDPNEFGFPSELEHIGRYQAHEVDAWVAYGLREDLAWEFQVAGMRASLRKSADDATGMPAELKESGLGDVRTRLNWRILKASARRPEIYTFATRCDFGKLMNASTSNSASSMSFGNFARS